MEVKLFSKTPLDYVSIFKNGYYGQTLCDKIHNINYCRPNINNIEDDILAFFNTGPVHYKYLSGNLVRQSINYENNFSLKFMPELDISLHQEIILELNKKFLEYNSDIKFYEESDDANVEILIMDSDFNTVIDDSTNGYIIHTDFSKFNLNRKVLLHEIIRYLYAINENDIVYQKASLVYNGVQQSIMSDASLGCRLDLFSYLHIHNLGVFFTGNSENEILRHELKKFFLPLTPCTITNNSLEITNESQEDNLELVNEVSATENFHVDNYSELVDIFDMIFTRSKKDLTYRFKYYNKTKLHQECKDMKATITAKKFKARMLLENDNFQETKRSAFKKSLEERREKNKEVYISYLVNIGYLKSQENLVKLEK